MLITLSKSFTLNKVNNVKGIHQKQSTWVYYCSFAKFFPYQTNRYVKNKYRIYLIQKMLGHYSLLDAWSFQII